MFVDRTGRRRRVFAAAGVYRQVMYLAVIQATVMALMGGRLRWHRMVRTGAATSHAEATATF